MGRIGTRLFGAQSRARKHFIGIGDIVRVEGAAYQLHGGQVWLREHVAQRLLLLLPHAVLAGDGAAMIHTEAEDAIRSEEHTSELQSHVNLVCRLLLEKKKKK